MVYIKFSKFIEDYTIIIFFLLFIIEWAITTWMWISSNQILSLTAKLFHFFFLLIFVTYPYVFMTYSITWFGEESAKLKWTNLEKVYQFVYGLYFWVVARIIEFTDFTSYMNNVIFLSISGFFTILTIFYVWKVHKRILYIIIMLISYISGVFKTLFFPQFSNVDLFMTVFVIIVWCILILFIIGGVIWRAIKS